MIGIDVSKYQGAVDWNAVRSDGVEFCMVKCSQGFTQKYGCMFYDPSFEKHLAGAYKAGIACGVYHYFMARSVADAISEADFAVSGADKLRDSLKLWIAVDVEEDSIFSKMSPALLTDAVLAFCDRVKEKGYRPMIYTNPNYLLHRFEKRIFDEMRKRDIALWLALWRSNKSKPEGYGDIAMWQHSSTGNVKGITGYVDMNYGYFELPGGGNILDPADVAVSADPVIKKGDRVKVKNPVIYGTDRFFKLYYSVYDVLSISGDRAVIGIISPDGSSVVTAAVDVKYIEKVR